MTELEIIIDPHTSKSPVSRHSSTQLISEGSFKYLRLQLTSQNFSRLVFRQTK